ISATQLAFGDQVVGTTSGSKTVTLANTGNAAVNFDSITVSGDFAKASGTTCAASLATNASCDILVTFSPTVTGGRAGAITISDNTPPSPQSITLFSNRTDIAITFLPVGFTS